MEQLINFIIRPPRAKYNPNDDLLDQKFRIKGRLYQRHDLEVVNDRGDILQCSHYMPATSPEGGLLPCVIYCHGNSGCRTDASEAAVLLLPSNITVFAFDFSGSGLSGGEHVTLGWNEQADLKAVVNYLRTSGKVSLIGLWGRSMGAVTSLMYGAEDPSIAGMVIDSPFSDLVNLMMELVESYKVRLPKFTVKFVIQYIRRSIQKKAKFDIMDLNTVKAAKMCFVPALFGHAIDDDFIRPQHSDLIFYSYAGDKNVIKFDGDHNSSRPQFYFDSVSIFFNNVLQPPPPEESSTTFFDLAQDRFSKDCWGSFDLEFSDEPGSSYGCCSPGDSSEDHMEQLRDKPPMSTMVVPRDISFVGNRSESKVEIRGLNLAPSSSTMIDLGSATSSNAAGSIDDDRYVQFHFNSFASFPTNVEDEERMIMKAMLKSLKDLKKSCAKRPSSDGDIALPKPILTPKNEQEAPSTTCGHKLLIDSETSGTSRSVTTFDNNALSDEPSSPDATAMTCCFLDSPRGVERCWNLSFFRN